MRESKFFARRAEESFEFLYAGTLARPCFGVLAGFFIAPFLRSNLRLTVDATTEAFLAVSNKMSKKARGR
jgi:hypothetical protein